MKFELIQLEQISIRESMGLVKDIYDPAATVRQPLSEYRTMLDLIHNDSTLATAYDIIVDFATYRGFDFIGGTKEKREQLRDLFETLNFRQIRTNILYSLCYYGDAFLELRKNNSKTPNELWVLETTEMRIIYDGHGKVTGYVQRSFDMSGMTEDEILAKEKQIDPETKKTMGIFFKPDEVIHYRMKWIGSQVYSYNPNQPIITEASTNLYAGNYLMNIFINMPPRYVAHLAGISPKDLKSAQHEFQAAKTNYKKTIAFSRSSDPQSKLTLQKIDPPYDKELIDIIKYLRNEILKVTRVPRSWVAESGVENRGVTEAEQRPFDVRIQAIHRNILEPVENMQLLPALGYSKKPSGSTRKLRLRNNEVSRKGEKEILENLGLLKNMGLKHDAAVRYMEERGILGVDEDDFEEKDPMEAMGMTPGKKFGEAPSRKPMNKSMDDMKSNLNEAGVSDESAKKPGMTA